MRGARRFVIYSFIFHSLTTLLLSHPHVLLVAPSSRVTLRCVAFTLSCPPRHVSTRRHASPWSRPPRHPCHVASRFPHSQPSSRLDNSPSLPSLWESGTRPLPHLALGCDMMSPHILFWDVLFHTSRSMPLPFSNFFFMVCFCFCFSSFFLFSLTAPLPSQVHRDPSCLQTRVGGPLFSQICAHGALATWFALLLFTYFLLTPPFPHRFTRTPFILHMLGGPPPGSVRAGSFHSQT